MEESNSKSSGQAPTIQPRGEFGNFRKLPAKIRILIWQYALVVPRIIKFDCRYNILKRNCRFGRNGVRRHQLLVGSFRQFPQENDISPLLHVCREARDEALTFGGFRDCRGFSHDIPLNWIKPRDLIARWLPFRPDTDIAFIATYEQYRSPLDQIDYSRQSLTSESIFRRCLKRVIFSKDVAKILLKPGTDLRCNGSSPALYGMQDLVRAFPCMQELEVSPSDEPEALNLNDYGLDIVVDEKSLRDELTEGLTAQSSVGPMGSTSWYNLIVRVSPSAWEHMRIV